MQVRKIEYIDPETLTFVPDLHRGWQSRQVQDDPWLDCHSGSACPPESLGGGSGIS